MSALETRVLVDGRWTRRTMDIYAILAGNKDEPERKTASKGPAAPPMGILTRTISHSPVLKWILPARIRARDKNDVVFIGERFIQIKELLPDGHLQDVVTKADFGRATIRAARVFGNTRQPVGPVDGQLKVAVREQDADLDIKMEDSNHTSTSQLPPQILILTLDSNQLVFLFAFHDKVGRVKFLSSHMPLLANRSLLLEPGKHLAVDPKSRAFAVAAYQKTFSIYALKPRSQLRNEIEREEGFSPERFKPVKEERHFPVEGIILKMEFLYPSPGDDDHVILLLVVSSDRTTRLLCFEWEYTESLRTVKQLGINGQPVGKWETLPILLIPLTIASAFILVCEHVVSVYRDILSGTGTRRTIPHSTDQPNFQGGSSRKAPLWTHWARPVRSAHYSSLHDDLFLCREDGIVKALEICEDSEIMLNAQVKAGVLGCNIDTAFASLDLGLSQPDLLIAGGDMSVGGLFEFQSRSYPKYIEAVPNWAPTIDYVLVPLQNPTLRQAASTNAVPQCGNRIFGCAGRNRYGACAEIRYGIEGRIGWAHNNEEYSNITDLWTLLYPSMDGLSLLLSFPLHSNLIHLSADGSVNPDESICQDGLDDISVGLDLGSRTLMAGTTAGGCFIQVTEGSMRVKRSLFTDTEESCLIREYSTQDKIIAAAVDLQSSSVVTVLRRNEGHIELCGCHVSITGSSVAIIENEQPIKLACEPTCLTIARIRNMPFAFVGTAVATIQVYHMSPTSGLVPIMEHTLIGERTASAVCHSALCISSKDCQLLLCGLRDGRLQTFLITADADPAALALTHNSSLTIGATSVNVSKNNSDSSTAFVICDSDFYQVSYDALRHENLALSTIWLTDANDPSYSQSAITAFSQFSSASEVTDSIHAGLLVLILGTKLIVASLDQTAKVVPRRMPVMGTPRRIIFSTQLNMLVLVVTMSEHKPAQQRASPGNRSRPRLLLRDCIKFLDTDQSSAKVERDYSPDLADKHAIPIGKAGERVQGIIDWSPFEGDRTYHFLVICTCIKRQEGLNTGRIAFFNARRNDQGEVVVTRKYQIPCDRPAYSVASFGSASLVYCSGTDLILQTLNLSEKKWRRVSKYQLRSPGIHISVLGSIIYVTTAADSLEILKFEGETLSPLLSDSIARDGLHHLALPNLGITLASDKACNVIGLWQPPSPLTATPATLFEAELPGSMIRLRHGSIKSPWRSSTSARGVLDDVIIGMSADGSLYQIILLTSSAWRLLRFIQNLCSRNARVCPLTYHRRLDDPVEPEDTNPRSFQVDGDILCRFIALEGSELQFMLDQLSSSTDAQSSRLKHERLKQLVHDVLQTEKDPVEAAMAWMRSLLQPLL